MSIKNLLLLSTVGEPLINAEKNIPAEVVVMDRLAFYWAKTLRIMIENQILVKHIIWGIIQNIGCETRLTAFSETIQGSARPGRS